MLKILSAMLAVAWSATAFCASGNSSSQITPPFHESFSGPDIAPGWTVVQSKRTSVTIVDGRLVVKGTDPASSHIQRPLGADDISLAADVTRSGAIYIEWDDDNWCGLGKTSPTPFGRFYSTWTRDGKTTEVDHRQVDFNRTDKVRIELGKDCIRFQYLGVDKSWLTLETIARKGGFAAKPRFVVAGRHFTLKHSSLEETEDRISAPEKPAIEDGTIDNIRMTRTEKKDLRMTADEKKWLGRTRPEPVNELLKHGTADPDYGQVANVYPPMRYAREAIGVPGGKLDIGVDWLGRLDVSPWTGPVAYFSFDGVPFANDPTHVNRSMQDGYLPISHLETTHHKLNYNITVQAWSKDMKAGNDLYAYVRFNVESDKASLLPEKATITDNNNKAKSFRLHPDGRGYTKCCFRYKFPDLSTAEEVSGEEFDRVQTEIVSTWKKLITPATRITVPDKRMQDAYRAWIVYSMINTDLVDGFPEVHDGTGFYDQMFGQSVSQYTMAIDLYGLHDLAGRILGTQMHYQKPDGSYVQECGLPDLGELMVAIPQHYFMTHDKDWLKEAAPNLVKGCNWILRKRAEAPKEGVTKGLIKFRPYNDYPQPVYNYLGNMLCAMGLEKNSVALADIGLTSESKAFAAEGKEFRADIYASMKASAFSYDGMMILPIEPDTHRVVKLSNYRGGDYYGLVAGQLMESGFFRHDDVQVTQLIDMLELRGGLIAGVCEFMDGIDHAYTYGYLMEKMARGNERNVVLGLWGMMAYGMTRDTNSPVEVSLIKTGENHYTLPHTYSVTSQLRLLRNILLHEDGNNLVIGQATPRVWIKPGKEIALKKAPTLFGKTSYRQTVEKDGTVKLHIDPPTREKPEAIVVHIRHFSQKPIKAVKTTPKVSVTTDGESLTLHNLSKPVDIRVTF